jgi:fructokinase
MQKQFKVVSIGEMLWDVFPDGAKFGGAPANVSCHCASLLGEAYMISCVGNDRYGMKAVEFLANRNVNVDGVTVSDRYPTGTVEINVDEYGKPEYVINRNAAWDNIDCNWLAEDIVKDADAVCFGSLAQREAVSRQTIHKLLDRSAPGCLKVFDVNLRLDYYNEDILRDSVCRADVLKLNDEELPVIAEIFDLSGNELEIVRKLIKTCQLDVVALTRGGEGALIVSSDTESDYAGIKVDNIVDTVGAGDSFTAALITGLLKDKTLDEINQNACRIAAYVCSQSGATPKLPQELL